MWHDNVYGAIIMTKVTARVHPVHFGSFDECRLSAEWPPTQAICAVSPLKIASYRPHPTSPLLLLLSSQAGTSVTLLRRESGCEVL